MTAAEVALSAMAPVRGVRITYARAGGFVELTAIPGSTSFEAVGDDGPVSFESRDYLIPACELVLDGEQTLPQRLDTITEPDGTIYEARAPQGQRVFRYSDPQRSVLRVFTFERNS